MNVSEFDESFDDDEKRVQGAILTQPLAGLLQGPPITMPGTATLHQAVQRLQEKHIGCLLVVGDDGRLTGIFTERDLLNQVIDKPVDLNKARLADHMTKKPETLTPTDKVAWALNKMHLGGFRHVPIVDAGGKPVGVVSVKNIVDFIVELFPAAVLNLPPDPSKEARVLDGG
jgi:CBS domain-containing protein